MKISREMQALVEPLDFIHGVLHKVTVSVEGVDLHDVDEPVVELPAEHDHDRSHICATMSAR